MTIVSLLSRSLTLALALCLCPQAAQPAAAVEDDGDALADSAGRRIRIILDSETLPATAAPTSATPTTEAPPERDDPGIAVAPLRPILAAARDTIEPPAEWTADAMRTPLMPGEGWRIQVGAFRDAGRAEAAIAAVEASAAGPGADPVRLVTPAAGASPAVYRAQMSGFIDRVAADAACARVTASGSACFVVAPAAP